MTILEKWQIFIDMKQNHFRFLWEGKNMKLGMYSFFLFIWDLFGGNFGDSQGLLLVLSSVNTPSVLGGPYEVPETKTGLAKYKASTLFAVLSLYDLDICLKLQFRIDL